MAQKTRIATLERYPVYGTMRHHLRLTYQGKTLRWVEGVADVWADWVDGHQTADLQNALDVATRMGFTGIRLAGNWAKRPRYCRVYINRNGQGYRETVSECLTMADAKFELAEYQSSDMSADYCISSRACAGWNDR